MPKSREPHEASRPEKNDHRDLEWGRIDVKTCSAAPWVRASRAKTARGRLTVTKY